MLKAGIACFVIAYVLALAVLAPAWVVAPLVAGFSQERLRLTHAEGSLWAGSGRLCLASPAQVCTPLTPVRWRLLPSALLRAHLRVLLVDPTGRDPTGVVDLYSTGVQLENLRFRIDASQLALIPALRSLQPRGQLEVEITQLRASTERIQGEASARWAGARLTQLEGADFGVLQARASASGQSARYHIQSREGPARLNATGEWFMSGGFHLKGDVTLAHASETLKALLSSFARETAPGQFSFDVNAR